MHKVDHRLYESARRVHVFFRRHGFYPVAIATGLCVGLFATRAYLSRTWIFSFMLWNLFLAWIPYLCSLGVALLYQRHPRRWWALLPPAVVGLAFFPNAPYIITDFLHLAERLPIPLWFDVGMLASFAWTGIVLAVYALRILQNVARVWIGSALSWVFVLAILGASGVGIYLGRFLRWNSWDLASQPGAILYDILGPLRSPLAHPRAIGVTLLFSALLLVCYLALTAGPRKPEELLDADERGFLDADERR